MNHVPQSIMLTSSTTSTFYLLLTISISLTKCINCYVVDSRALSGATAMAAGAEAAAITTLTHSEADSIHYNSNNSINNNRIQKSSNVTAIIGDAAIDNVLKPRDDDAADYLTANGEHSDSQLNVETGRKKYGFGKKKKYRKLLLPVLIGLFITKMIMFPMFVKAVTILSSASFVFSKMSLLASLILGLKFFLANNNQNTGDSKVEVVHVPLKKYSGGDWDRETSETKLHNAIADNIYEHDFRPTHYIL